MNMKTIVEMMELTNKQFDCVRVVNGNAYATNAQAMVTRPIDSDLDGFFLKEDLPILKAHAKTGKDCGDLLAHGINFPDTSIIENAFTSEFQFEINLNGDNLIKLLKSLKGKDNKITIKIKDSNSPILISHVNGKGLIAPIL